LHDYLHFDFESGVEQVLLEDVPLGVPFAVSFPDLITDAVASIKKELYSAASKHQSDILSSLGKIFLYRIKNELDAPTCPKSAKTVFKALHKLRSDIYLTPQLPRTIDSISKQLNISRSYLQHTYKELFGVSCIEDIIIARLTAAKAMLMSSDLTVNEIAEKCGYQSCSHFIRQFGSREGISPEKFRNK
jgi:AraC family transcriptional regulator of arabinose operon